MDRITLTIRQTQFQFNTIDDSRRTVKRVIRQDKNGSYIIFRGSQYRVEQKTYEIEGCRPYTMWITKD